MVETPSDHRDSSTPRPSASQCLTDEELTRVLQGLALGERHDVLIRHLDGCPGCRLVLAEAARHMGSRRATRLRWALIVGVVAVMLLAVLTLWFVR